jgi:hypothetical protein
VDKRDVIVTLPSAPINKSKWGLGGFSMHKEPWELLRGDYRGALAQEELL